ncbi:hypothetical protein D1007_10807 [Hordeum vulgare]|nr:hypothetical protein D1007_10807 [Hordeum vulgare]
MNHDSTVCQWLVCRCNNYCLKKTLGLYSFPSVLLFRIELSVRPWRSKHNSKPVGRRPLVELVVMWLHAASGSNTGILRRSVDGCGNTTGNHIPNDAGYEVCSEATSGWTRRVRIGRAPAEREPNPDRKSALELALRAYAEKQDGVVVKPEIGTSFDSLDEGFQFYNLYSWEVGFGVRFAKSRLNVERRKCMHEIVCACAGAPLKENSRSIRTGCTAMIRPGKVDGDSNRGGASKHGSQMVQMACTEEGEGISGYTLDKESKLQE